MLRRDDTVLALLDVQGRLATLMHDREALYRSLVTLVQGVQALGLPILWMEQYPKGLGPTIPELIPLLTGQQPLAKTCFSACGLPEFVAQLRATGRRQVLLAGIETHICVYQTGRDLLSLGYHVEVVTDGVSSRTATNRQLALERLHAAGAALTSVEMCLFELLREAGSPAFRQISQLVR
jgi:hypothetical protein